MTLSGRVTGYIVAGAIAAALLFWTFGRISAFLGHQDAMITEASRAQLKVHATLVRQRQQLLALERRFATQASASRTAADSLRRLLATGQRVDTVQVLVEIATRDSSAAESCGRALVTCQARAASAEAEADSLHKRLTDQVTVRDRRCGLFGGVGTAAGWKAGAGLTLGVGCRLWP